MTMVNSNQLIDSWVVEYLAHTCVKGYFEDGCNSLQLRRNHVLILTSFLNEERDSLSCREYVCLLFLHLLCMEEDLARDDSQTHSDYIGTDDFRESMPKHIAFASRDSKSESTKKLASHCLIQTYAVVFKNCLRKDTDWQKALKDFQSFVALMPIEECQSVYDECAKMKSVETSDDFISEYMDLIRHLVLTLYSEFDDPYLIKLAQSKVSINDGNETGIESLEKKQNSTSVSENNSENDNDIQQKDDTSSERITAELKVLLRDQRPSRKSDLEEIKLEESDSLSKIRKKAEKFNAHKHKQNIIRLERRIKKKPPSHQNLRGGPWMVEEEEDLIRKTLEIGVGKWKDIKAALKTFRSSQQLKDKWRLLKPWQIDEVLNEGKKYKRPSL